MSSMNAIRTEYKGIVFDSKLEATFARALDLYEISWEEKHPIEHCGHLWDFMLYLPVFSCVITGNGGYRKDSDSLDPNGITGMYGYWSYEPVLLELKPSRPTDTYMQNLRQNFKVYGTCSPVAAIVAYGSQFKPAYDHDGVVSYFMTREVAPNFMGEMFFSERLGFRGEKRYFDECFLEATKYRFDLQ